MISNFKIVNSQFEPITTSVLEKKSFLSVSVPVICMLQSQSWWLHITHNDQQGPVTAIFTSQDICLSLLPLGSLSVFRFMAPSWLQAAILSLRHLHFDWVHHMASNFLPYCLVSHTLVALEQGYIQLLKSVFPMIDEPDFVCTIKCCISRSFCNLILFVRPWQLIKSDGLVSHYFCYFRKCLCLS